MLSAGYAIDYALKSQVSSFFRKSGILFGKYTAGQITQNNKAVGLEKQNTIRLVRLTNVSLEDIVSHMNDPRVAENMPLLAVEWTLEDPRKFVATKEKTWQRDGLGHWAILSDEACAGWGEFQKESDDWDFGPVLKPDKFGLGIRVSRMAIEFAKSDARIEKITFLLPPSRKHLGTLARGGAKFVATLDTVVKPSRNIVLKRDRSFVGQLSQTPTFVSRASPIFLDWRPKTAIDAVAAKDHLVELQSSGNPPISCSRRMTDKPTGRAEP